MLRDPELLRRVVSAMRARTRGWLSAKMRAGFDDAAGAVASARLIEAAGADLIAVHPRRQVDFFQGVADWRIIAEIKRSVSIPVIGNGDVWYAADALRMRAETGCDGVMIGRGALRNPWIFQQLDARLRGLPVPRPNGDDVLAHFDALAELFERQAPGRTVGMLKEQLRYLCRCVPDASELTRRAARSAELTEMRAVLGERLQGERAEALDLGAEGGQLERSGSVLAA